MSSHFHAEGGDLHRIPTAEMLPADTTRQLGLRSGEVKDLVSTLLHGKITQLLALLLVLVCLQGCNIMHRPRLDEEQGFLEAEEPVEHRDAQARRRDMRRLLADPQGPENRALLSGISSEQRERIMEHFSRLFDRVRLTDFVEFLRICTIAREELGIMNFDRYEPNVLREAVRNFQDPEANRDKPAVIVIIARPDEATIGGVQPLNVESYQVGRLLPGHKVFLFECASAAEVLHQITRLRDRGLVQRGRLRGLIIGSHGSSQFTEAGVTAENLPALAVLREYLDRGQSSVVLANCHSGEGSSAGDNLTNRLFLFLGRELPKGLRVYGCDGLLAGVDFDLDPSGALQPDSLRLQSLSDRLTLGLTNNTYVADSREALIREQMTALRSQCSREISDDFLRSCVEFGFCDKALIERLSRERLSPDRYASFIAELAGRGVALSSYATVDCMRQSLTPESIGRYFESVGHARMSGIFMARDILYFELGITPELITQYRAQLPTLSEDQVIALRRKNIAPSDLQRLREQGLDFRTYELVEALTTAPDLTLDQLLHFARLGMRDLYRVRRLLALGINENLYGNFCLLGVRDYFAILDYAEKGVSLDALRTLKGAGFDVSNSAMVVDALVTRAIPLGICVSYGQVGIRSFHDMNYLLAHGIDSVRAAQGLAAGHNVYQIVLSYASPRTVAGMPR